MQKKTTSSDAVKLAVIGASVAALAASAYFLFGPKGKTHQRHAKAWAIKMKGDVVERLEAAREITEPLYHEIIDSVAKDYIKGMKASKDEIEMLAKDLKKHWKTISKSARAIKQEVTQQASRVVKKARR